MRNEERREITTRKLLDATKALLKEKGCHAITMKDIMDQSSLSKGAIFHYVKSKDEIYAMVLHERLEETNAKFMRETEHAVKTFDGPMQSISHNLIALEDPNDLTNKVLKYLLGKEDDPTVAGVLQHFYERSVSFAKNWITIGQIHGVIMENVNPDQTAEMFVLLSLGLRVRSSFASTSAQISTEVSTFMSTILKNQSK
ncbi:TetR family transcriptional regulator [Paenibacillus sp. Soil766]|uniref:TetR/AcrR family transcriptional regulator n=1 Tax=Paenibacillus sp. Soil766 TaxID=1736404 RepID=UPI000710B163|nr:TetR/AcrR family transcriptional regulator [Paenibacillus sp. Soil766]KRF03773.1 TetR family transcriptional regulator [Paenibacillus sp. Soil766]